MADFPIEFRVSDYITEYGQVVRAKRGYLLCELSGFPIICDAFIDTAAPFCVVPYTYSSQLTWSRQATSLTKPGLPSASVLLWQGIPCDLGTVSFRCVQLATGVRSRLLSCLAKFPTRTGPTPGERTLVLGLSLLD